MLTVITGAPGAGKTAYTVERILMPLAKKEWQEDAIDEHGQKVVFKRRLLTNINGLLLEHEKIDAEDLARWHEWAKPGDLIVFDEVQKPWPLTGANKEQPKCITELETHRHYGIDMVLLTQHPMLINAAIVRLAGQHKHVRRVGNSRLSTVYEWDGVSRTLLYKNSFAKKAWRRGKAVEGAYKSSSLHTKQKRAIPTAVYIFALAALAFPFMGTKVFGDLQARFFGGEKPAAQVAAATPLAASAATASPGVPTPSTANTDGPIDDRTAWIPRVSFRPESAPAYDAIRQVVAMPVVAGGICNPKGCKCITQQGTDAGLTDRECRDWLAAPTFNAYQQQQPAHVQPNYVAPPELPQQPGVILISGGGARDPQGAKAAYGGQ